MAEPAGMLPVGLRPWAGPLAALDAELATALGPMIRTLDGLVSAHDRTADAGGEFDGWRGITTRGHVDRLLLTDWALAAHVPAEFERRLVAGELSYLEAERTVDGSRGATCLLLDTGPGQLGAPRLVQLALAIVLHRRATARGSVLQLGLLGDEPGTWITGPFPELLSAWLNARTAPTGDTHTLPAWIDALDDPGHAWVAGSRSVTERLNGINTAQISEQDWGPDGASSAQVVFRDRTVILRLPSPRIAVRALRSPSRSVRGPGPSGSTSVALRAPCFPSYARTLLLRGDRDHELVTVALTDQGFGRPRRHSLPGRAVGAGLVGRRLVTIVERGGTLRTHVVGKPLHGVEGMHTSVIGLGLQEEDLDFVRPPGPVYVDGGNLLWHSPAGWVRFGQGRPAALDPSIAAVGPAGYGAPPRICLQAAETMPPRSVPESYRVAFGPAGSFAWTTGDDVWHLSNGTTIASVPAQDEMLGILTLRDRPALLSVSPAGLIIRLHTPDDQRTLTAWSGGLERPALHPDLPLMAVRPGPHRIEVVDLTSDQRVARLETPE